MKQSETDYLNTRHTYPDKKLEQVRPHVILYEKYAAGKRREYLVLRIPALIIGIVLPILVIIQSSRQPLDWFSKLTIGVSLLVVIFTSVDVFSRYGKA